MKMIRKANKTHIDWMVEMSYQKRLNYSKKQKIFWKISENSNEIQKKYFEKELKNKNVIALIYQEKQGFVIGKLISPPEVYDAGLTLMIDDFCVKSDDLWLTVGKELLNECKREAKIMNAKQILVVCGDHDRQKFLLLETMNMRVASRWYTKTI